MLHVFSINKIQIWYSPSFGINTRHNNKDQCVRNQKSNIRIHDLPVPGSVPGTVPTVLLFIHEWLSKCRAPIHGRAGLATVRQQSRGRKCNQTTTFCFSGRPHDGAIGTTRYDDQTAMGFVPYIAAPKCAQFARWRRSACKCDWCQGERSPSSSSSWSWSGTRLRLSGIAAHFSMVDVDGKFMAMIR